MLRNLSVFRLFAVLLAMLAAPPAAQAGRTVWINTDNFYNEQSGIPALVTAMNNLNNEFRPKSTEIGMLNNQATIVERDLTAAVAANDSVAATLHDNKLRELQLVIKRKTEEASLQIEKRRQALVAPIEAKVIKAMSAYATAKGIDVILDARSDPLYLSPTWQLGNDATAEFITWYNAQPAN